MSQKILNIEKLKEIIGNNSAVSTYYLASYYPTYGELTNGTVIVDPNISLNIGKFETSDGTLIDYALNQLVCTANVQVEVLTTTIYEISNMTYPTNVEANVTSATINYKGNTIRVYSDGTRDTVSTVSLSENVTFTENTSTTSTKTNTGTCTWNGASAVWTIIQNLKHETTIIEEIFDTSVTVSNVVVEYHNYYVKTKDCSYFYYNRYNGYYYALYGSYYMKCSKLESTTVDDWTDVNNDCGFVGFSRMISTPSDTYVVGKTAMIARYDTINMSSPTKVLQSGKQTEYFKLVWKINNKCFFADTYGTIYELNGKNYTSTSKKIPYYKEAYNYILKQWGNRYVLYPLPVTSANVKTKCVVYISDNGIDFKETVLLDEEQFESMSVGGNDEVLFAYLPNGKLYVMQNTNTSVDNLTWVELPNEMGSSFIPKMYFVNGVLVGFVSGDTKTYIYNGVGSQWLECKSKTYETNGEITESKPSDCGSWNNIFIMEDDEKSAWIYTSTNNMSKLKIIK